MHTTPTTHTTAMHATGTSRWPRLVAFLAVGLLLAGCGAGGDAPADAAAGSPVVVATTSVLGDIAANVLGGTGAEIEVLMPPGADPHGYSPSAADGVKLREADLVVAVGLGLEESLEDTLDAAEADGVAVLRVAALVDPIEYGGAAEHADKEEHADEEEPDEEEEPDDADEHGDDGGSDPHVWLDPLRAAAVGQEIAAAYTAVAPDAADTVGAAADAYEARLVALDEELQALVATVPAERRTLITNHDALGYLAARYDLEVIATVLPGTSADVDVTAGAFTSLVELLRDTGVPAVFAETTSSDRLAQALASEVEGVDVIELYTDSLGEPGSDGETLVAMLRADIERIVAALG